MRLGLVTSALALAPVLVLGACGGGGGAAADDGRAARLKSDMDAATRALVPRLREVVGSEVVSLRGRFTECQVSGTWRYVVDGQLKGEPTDPAEQADRARRILADEGYDARVDDDLDARVDTGDFTISVTPGRRGTATSYALGGLTLESPCEPYGEEDADLAQQDGGEEFTDLRS
jgi:hypothetical protein